MSSPEATVRSIDRTLLRRIELGIVEGAATRSLGRRWLRAYARARHELVYRGLRSHRLIVGSPWRMVLAAALRRGDVFLDVGGNVGRIAHSAAWLVGPEGAVHTFEPSPAISAVLRRRVQYFGLSNVVVNETALGANPGEGTLHEYEAGLGGSSSLRPGSSPGEAHDRETPVPVQTLDGYAHRVGLDTVRVVKVDVEGAELDVLTGARDLLAASRPALLVEASRDTCSAFGHTLDELIEAITAAGYDIYSWRRPSLVQVSSAGDVPAERHHDDFLALRSGDHDDILTFMERAARGKA